MTNKNYLLIVAHPDDEILGAGGTIFKLASSGNIVNLCILSGDVSARKNRPDLNELYEDMHKSANLIGINSIELGAFPNIEFNMVPHIELVKFIEKSIIKLQPDVIITHHPNDLNNDHFHTSLACQAAVRISQRDTNIKPVTELLFMEVLSSTEWSSNVSFNAFLPNVFFEIHEEGVQKKIDALNQYKGVMRNFPHPRSPEIIKGLAAYRGGQVNLKYAEAFQLAFKRISDD